MQPLVGGFAIFCEGCFYVMGYVLLGKLPYVRTAYVLIFCLYFFSRVEKVHVVCYDRDPGYILECLPPEHTKQ